MSDGSILKMLKTVGKAEEKTEGKKVNKSLPSKNDLVLGPNHFRVHHRIDSEIIDCYS